MPPSETTPGNEPAGMPNEGVRTAITLVLIAHLFLAALGMIAAMPVAMPSLIVARLHENVFELATYPDVFLMQSYAFPLTQATEGDWDSQAEVVLNWQNGDENQPDRLASRERQSLFSASDLPFSARRVRYLALLQVMGSQIGQEGTESILTNSTADRLLQEAELPDGTHRFRLRRIPTPQPSFAEASAATPEAVPFEANLVVRGGRLVSFTKAERQGLSSPVTRGASQRRPLTPADKTPPAKRTPAGDAPAGSENFSPGIEPVLPFPLRTPGGIDVDR